MKDDLEGTLINGKYRVLKRLGHGGMGMVYLANVEGPAGFEKLVALKVVHAHIAHDVQVIEMFLSEARLSAQLSHANIAQIYDLGESDGLHYLAMEYVRGRDLRALLRAVDEHEGRVPLPLCVFIVSKLCEALDHAHALCDRSGSPLKLVHRDVTPVNCLLGYAGEVKLIDFGIAKAANIASSTRAGMIRGKLAYMSPEQTRGQPLDRRSDIFALGVILFELLIGGRPFDLQDDNELNMIERIRTGVHPRAAELDPEVLPALDRIVEKALAVDRDLRYQTAGEMQEDLQRLLITQQIHVSAKDLGAFLIEMVGVEAARVDGAAPAELTAQTSLKRTPEGKSELRARIITQPNRDQVAVDHVETKDHVAKKDLNPTRIVSMATVQDLEPVEEPGGAHPTQRIAPLPASRPRRSDSAAPTLADRGAAHRATPASPEPVPSDRVPTENVPSSALRGARGTKTVSGKHAAAASTLITPGATHVPTENLLVEVVERAVAHGAEPSSSGASKALVPAVLLLVLVIGGLTGWSMLHEPEVPVVTPFVVAPEPTPVREVIAAPQERAVDAGMTEVATQPAVVEPVKEPPPPVVAALEPAEPKVKPTRKPVVVVEKPKPVEAVPVPEPEPELKPKLPVVSAFVTVRANQRSEVFVDGKPIGETPRLRSPVAPGKHSLRVDCVFPWGRQAGPTKELDLPAWAEAEVQHECVEKKP